jgi:hypothetical protein
MENMEAMLTEIGTIGDPLSPITDNDEEDVNDKENIKPSNLCEDVARLIIDMSVLQDNLFVSNVSLEDIDNYYSGKNFANEVPDNIAVIRLYRNVLTDPVNYITMSVRINCLEPIVSVFRTLPMMHVMLTEWIFHFFNEPLMMVDGMIYWSYTQDALSQFCTGEDFTDLEDTALKEAHCNFVSRMFNIAGAMMGHVAEKCPNCGNHEPMSNGRLIKGLLG